MKKILSLVALLGAIGGAAFAAPYYVPTPAGGELTVYDWQPVYSVDALYNFTDKDPLPDTYGARLNFSLYSDSVSTVRHEFSCHIGYEQGIDKNVLLDEDYNERGRIEMRRIPATVGYDANISLTDHVLLDLGGQAGYAWGIVKTSDPELGRDSTGGFTFSLDAGIKIQFSEAIYMKVGYEYTRTFYQKCYDGHLNFGQHSIVFGVGARW